MKKILLILLGILCLFLAGCQSAPLSEVHEESTAAPTAIPRSLPTKDPNASWKDVLAYYKAAEETDGLLVRFSAESGFYSEDVSLVLAADGDSDIFYTDDGSDPTPQSQHYERPIPLAVTDAELPRCAVIRAAAYFADGTKSPVFTHVYFLNNKIGSRFNTPVISIVGPPSELTSGPDALLVGSRALDTRESASRTVLVQMFLRDGTEAMRRETTLRVYGSNSSREMPVKSLLLTAGTATDAEEAHFPYAVFDSLNAQEQPMDHYRELLLSNGESDFQYAFIRDELGQALAKQARFEDYEDFRPVVVYLNGEYYGLHWLHEVYSDAFFQAVYGESDGRYAVIDWSEEKGAAPLNDADQAAADAFQSAYKHLLTLDYVDVEDEDALRGLLDVENYLDYCALNIFIDNESWPSQMRLYAYIPSGENVQSVQWRCLPHGMDSAFGLNIQKNAAARDTLEAAMDPQSARYAPLFAKLMKYAKFRAYFVDRMASLLESSWSRDTLQSIIKELHNARSGEMKHYITRLDTLRKVRNSLIWMKESNYNKSYSELTNYLKARPDAVAQSLEANLPPLADDAND